jgi:two-component sensor histidine kinase
MPRRLFLSLFLSILCLLTSESAHSQINEFPLNPEKLRYAREVEQEAKAKNDSVLLAESYYLYGKLYAFAGDHATSKGYYVKSLRILEPRGNSFELGRLYVRLSENFKFYNTPEEIQYIYRSLKVFKSINSQKGQLMSYSNLGQLHLRKSESYTNRAEMDSARSCFLKVESFAHAMKDTLALAEADLHLGELFYATDIDKSIDYLETSVGLLTGRKNLRSQISALMTLGNAYIKSGQSEKGYATLLKAREIYQTEKLRDQMLSSNLNRALMNYYQSKGQWKAAMSELWELYTNETNQFKTERDGALLRLQVEYETEKKELQISAQQKELELNNTLLQTQRNFIFITAFMLVLATVLSILFFRSSVKNKRTSDLNKHLVREQNHRAKNNLQMISSLLSMQERLLSDSAAKKVVEESRLRVQSMAIIQRKLYDGQDAKEIVLSDFIPELAAGVLHAYGFPDLESKYAIEPIKIETDKAISLGLILTELITNACKYAFPDHPNPILSISCTENSGQIYLTVTDNGPGMNDKQELPDIQEDVRNESKNNSFGMHLIQLQVSQLYGNCEFVFTEGTTFKMWFTA